MSIAEKLNQKLLAWSKGKEIVVAIDGYSGAGKTALLREVGKINRNIVPVFMDDFILPLKKRQELLSRIGDKSKVFELHWYDYDKILKLVKRFRQAKLGKKILVIEGVFLHHSSLFKNLWDKKVFLKVNKSKADKRRIRREKRRWGKDYFPETHPDSFVRLFRLAYQRYMLKYKPDKEADLTVNL